MPLVSIIVPVYNVGKYLEKCVDSLINQTLEDIEIILIDDGSPDNSGEICDKKAAKDKRIHVIHQKNQGVSVARNAGLDYATGQWITFVDGDDWVASTLCEETVNFADKNNADVVLFGYYSAYDNKDVPSRLIAYGTGDISTHKLNIECKTISQYSDGKVLNNGVSTGTTWGKLIKASIIQNNRLRFIPGLTRAQDTIFWLYGFDACSAIYELDKELYYYRITNDSVTSGTKYMPNCEYPFGELINQYEKFVYIKCNSKEYIEALNLRKIQIASWFVKHKILHPRNTDTIRKKVSDIKELVNSDIFNCAFKNVRIDFLPKSLKVFVYLIRKRSFYGYYLFYILYSRLNNRTKAR